MQHDSGTSTAFYQVKEARQQRIYIGVFMFMKLLEKAKNTDKDTSDWLGPVLGWGECKQARGDPGVGTEL